MSHLQRSPARDHVQARARTNVGHARALHAGPHITAARSKSRGRNGEPYPGTPLHVRDVAVPAASMVMLLTTRNFRSGTFGLSLHPRTHFGPFGQITFVYKTWPLHPLLLPPSSLTSPSLSPSLSPSAAVFLHATEGPLCSYVGKTARRNCLIACTRSACTVCMRSCVRVCKGRMEGGREVVELGGCWAFATWRYQCQSL